MSVDKAFDKLEEALEAYLEKTDSDLARALQKELAERIAARLREQIL